MRRSYFTDEQWDKMKYACRTDLYYLGKDVLEKDFVEGTHRAMCDFYVQKIPGMTFKDFGKSYKGSHDRLMLVPRETFKSSIKVLDNVQWIINYPEVRILTVTAAVDLATAFINQLSSYFAVKGNAERNPATNCVEGGRPNLFQLLFIEFCITESEANSGEFNCPVRHGLGIEEEKGPDAIAAAMHAEKEPTAGVISMGGTSSGWHCDILDYDDPVSDRNSESGNQLDKLKDRIDMIFELMMNYGFRHTVATRYNPMDPYGMHAQEHGIVQLYGDFENDGLKYMCRPCLWLKDKPYEQPDYKGAGFPAEEDVDLFFPEGSPYIALKKKFKNKKIFFSQQLNDPIESADLSFTEEMLRDCIVDHSAIPKVGTIYMGWDLAWALKARADYTVGIVALLDARREWWITNIIRGRFDFSEKCFQIVNAIQQFKPQTCVVEDVWGARGSMLEPMFRFAKNMNVDLDNVVDWAPLGRNTDDAKYLKMMILHPWVRERRIHFLNTIDCLEDLIHEFRSVGIKKARNDIPDAMQLMVSRYSGAPTNIQADPKMVDQQWQQLRESEFDRLIFGRGRYAPGGEWDKGLWNVDQRRQAEQQQQQDPLIDPMTGLPASYPL